MKNTLPKGAELWYSGCNGMEDPKEGTGVIRIAVVEDDTAYRQQLIQYLRRFE